MGSARCSLAAVMNVVDFGSSFFLYLLQSNISIFHDETDSDVEYSEDTHIL